MKIDLSNFSGFVTYEKGSIVASYEKDNFYRYYDQEEIRLLKEENKHLKEKIDILIEDNSQLEDIRVKVIEYIKHYGNLYCLKHTQFKKYKQYEALLEILGDKE